MKESRLREYLESLGLLGATCTMSTYSGYNVTAIYAVVEQSQLTISNNLNGSINPFYPESLQPRDRTTKESIDKVAAHSKNIQLSRLSKSDSSGDGAPVVGPDMCVESGNGRCMAIRKAYFDGKADDYKSKLTTLAGQLGVSSDAVSRLHEPVLIRLRETPLDRAKFAEDSNKDNAMLESVSADSIDIYLRVIEEADSVDDVKQAIIEAAGVKPTGSTESDNVIEAANMLTAMLKPPLLALDIGAYKKAYEASSTLLTYSCTEVASPMIFDEVAASRFWIDDSYSKAHVLFNIKRNLALLEGDSYDEALKAQQWFISVKQTLGSVSNALLSYFAGRKVDFDEREQFYNPVIDPDSFADNPLTALTAPNRAYLDALLGANSVERVDDAEAKRAIRWRNDEDTDSYDAIYEQHRSKLGEQRDQVHKLQLEYEMISSRPKFSQKKSDAAYKRYVKAYDTYEKTHNKVGDLSKGAAGKRVEKAVEAFIKHRKIPKASDVGIGYFARMTLLDGKERYGRAVERTKRFMVDVISNSEESYLPTIRKAADAQLKDGHYSAEDLRLDADRFTKLTNGQHKSVEFDYLPQYQAAHANTAENYINIGNGLKKSTLWHELGHVLEDSNPHILKASIVLLNKRYAKAKNPKIINMGKAFKEYAGRQFGEHIINHYVYNPYASKFYSADGSNTLKNIRHTELISSGLEWLSKESMIAGLMQDKDHYELIMSVLIELNKSKSKIEILKDGDVAIKKGG